MKIAAALTAIFLMLGGSVAGSYFLSASAVRRATANTASITQLCRAGNEARAQQVQLWAHLVTLSAAPPRETAEARARREGIEGRHALYLMRNPRWVPHLLRQG